MCGKVGLNSATDDSIGSLIRAARATGRGANTAFVFRSGNGIANQDVQPVQAGAAPCGLQPPPPLRLHVCAVGLQGMHGQVPAGDTASGQHP
jgi:hypothetical protein